MSVNVKDFGDAEKCIFKATLMAKLKNSIFYIFQGSQRVDFINPTAILPDLRLTNEDICACKRFWKRRQQKWGCVKPCCAEEGAETGCRDQRRCRKCNRKKQN